MKFKDGFSSLELSKRLKELGVKQESHYTWVMSEDENDDGDMEEFLVLYKTELIKNNLSITRVIASSWSVAELGEILPAFIPCEPSELYEGNSDIYVLRMSKDYKEGVGIRHIVFYHRYCFGSSGGVLGECMPKELIEANSRAKLLIWLIEQGKVKA